MNDCVIALRRVEFSYPKGQFHFFCDDATFPAGQVTLISGANGSGKTTLSKLMCGILRPSRGTLLINGAPASDWSLGKIGKVVGYLFQEPARQLFTATVWEEMTFIDGINGVPTEQTAEKAEKLLSAFGLLGLRDNNTFRLSRGEKQRLALCAILMQGAKFLILDEPTTGLTGTIGRFCTT
jgi:energy-coupling factor transport system ATP-binding protein